MKKNIALSIIMLLILSFVFAACGSSPKAEKAPPSPEEIAAAEAEVQAAEEKLAQAEAEARVATDIAKENQTQENIAAFYEKYEAWDKANKELTQAKNKLKKLQQ